METSMSDTEERIVPIGTEGDIVVARRAVRDVANSMGFGITDTTRIVTAASELARNIVKYAVEGSMSMRVIEHDGIPGLELEFSDKGPGIADVRQALTEGYSTTGGLGMGLPGARKLMDDLQIQSTVGKGTRVVIRKWRKK